MNQAGIIMIDFIQLIKSTNKGSSYERMTEVITKIKHLAKNTNSLVISVSQLSREAQDGSVPVRLHMLRDSGALEEQSDYVVGAWRPELDFNHTDDPVHKNKIYINVKRV